MKKYFVEAYTTNGNGVRVTTTVPAESAEEAELSAGRKFMDAGFDGQAIKIERITEK